MTNVQLSKYSDFVDKKFLVVDDFPEFRTAIKRMVEAFGGKDIDTASNGEDAIAKIKAKRYDVILCDYNLGDGKDGQQVLEEAKYTKVVKESQIFIMLTAENTAEMVMGALEYEPDSYLVKPFNKEMVHARLMKTISKKRELEHIYKAIENNKLEEAIKMCDECISAGGKLALPSLKIKGQLLIKLEKYQDAIELYKSVLDLKEFPWALMGIGKSNFLSKKYQEAIEYFEKIIQQSSVNVEGYDWIAKTQTALEDYRNAQTTLEKAVRLSSKAIIRQQNLADLSYRNEDFEVSEKAYKNAVSLGKHSCYARPEDFLKYTELLITRSKTETNERIALRLGNDSVAVLENLLKIYRNDKPVEASAYIMLSLAMHVIKREDKAKAMLEKGMLFVEKEQVKIEPHMMVKLGEALVICGDTAKGEAMIKKYKSNSG